MKKSGKAKNMVIAQSGGPSMVINASLYGAVIAAKRSGAKIGKILGARHGIQGILGRDYLDLRKVSERKLISIALTPSSALGSCRMKPTAEDCRKIFEEFKRLEVGFFFYIGGNDSADAARIIGEEAEKDGYPLVVYHIPKTIDNDLRSCDHTPGFASAAKFVACALKGDDLDNRALGGVKIDIIMGRDAGFLTAASALARENKDDGPHLIYLPERPFSLDGFVKDVQAAMKRFGRCVVAVSEGIRDAKGELFAKKFAGGERDSHGNLQLSGTGALGDFLAGYLKKNAAIKRVRADTFGYLQRSFPGLASETDITEASMAGGVAVKCAIFAAQGLDGLPVKGTIGIQRAKGKKYKANFVPLPAQAAAKFTRSMPDRYIARNGHDVTKAFIEYAKPLVGDLPHCEIF
jgi:6-phosphofructokinase 1